ncbi:hypothetical protein M9H77_33912 [Catharanthus roseus]|uniref:Uncharacterized protein n=1 Tax=Catharanthus roseus TaxID=4058 RepID=A0ACB9ZLV1_CATRO|nr:hypothetical protein M9H77_33912 [Catharanthus roseus]
MSISHLVANDPEIPILNIIQEVQVLYQTGCTYKQAWYAQKFAIEKVFGSWDTTFNILPKYLQAVQDINPEHKVTTYHPQEGIYMVKSPIRVSGTGNNIYTLRLNNKFCSCGKWQTYTLPCSHVFAVCRENGSRTDAYVPEIYS